MDWHLKKFSDLTIDELYNILKLRTDVFIVEQQCAYEAIDIIPNQFHETVIRISAQGHLIKFYQSLGFEVTSAIY